MKKFLSAVLSAAMLTASCPIAWAASDLDSHWAKPYITYLSDKEIMKPSADGDYKPNQAVMRAEFMRYLNRAFDFTEKSNINFTDVTDSGSWYYEPVQVAVAHGYITGVGNNKMDPFSNITREQAATIIGRLHKATPASNESSVKFKDKSQISSWASPYIAEAVEAGYLVGYPDGSFKPKGTITRAEFAKILYNYMGSSLNKSGASYTKSDLRDDVENVTISQGCTLSNAEVKGDLYITEGVMDQTVTLADVKVEGKIIVSGGAVTLDNVTTPKMIVSTPLKHKLNVTATGNTNIGKTEVQTDSLLSELSMDVSAGGFSDIVITGDNNPTVGLDAEVWDVEVQGNASINTTSSTTINTILANAKVNVTGSGSVQKAILKVSGSEFDMEPANVDLASGVTANIAGENTSSTNSVTISPVSLSIDLGDSNAIDHSTDFKMSGDTDKVTKLSCDEKTLKEGTDYRLITDGFRLYATWLNSLKEGKHELVVSFEDGSRGSLPITIVNSSKNYIDLTEVSFDKYHDSSNYSNITATLQLSKGTTLDSVKLSSTVLERGTDYTYNGTTGTVILNRESLEKRTTGSYTITFHTSAGNDPTLKLNVVDTSPKNQLTPASIDFDANSGSGGFQDMTVKLFAVDGAELKSITCGNISLQENWQYRVSGSDVIINRTALADLASKNTEYIDLTFNMSKGDSPVLRVNYVTTFAVKVTVQDDLKEPIEGAEVSIAPTGDSATQNNTSSGTPAQTLVTNSEGKATVYVKRGTYVVTAKHDKFENAISTDIRVNGSQTVPLTAAIMEDVDIYVTDSTGAKLGGATVSIGNQSTTTEANGHASFRIARGNYTIRVSCPGYSSATQSISISQAATQRIVLSVGR